MSAPVRDFELERYLLGELDADATLRVRAAVTSDPDVAARLAALEASNTEILARQPASEVARAIEARRRAADARAAQTARRPTRFLMILAPTVATAALVFSVVSRDAPDGGKSAVIDTPFGDRAKGDPGLSVFLRRGADVQELKSGDPAHPGDVLQLSYTPAGRAYGIILSIDGASAVTLHYPEDPRASTQLSAGTSALPHSYELDAAPGFERFFFLASDRPIAVDDALAKARALARDRNSAEHEKLGLGAGVQEVSTIVRKAP